MSIGFTGRIFFVRGCALRSFEAMLILGIFSGYHDAHACLFDDYRMVAAVAL